MDFDSLKVTAKMNSGSYELKDTDVKISSDKGNRAKQTTNSKVKFDNNMPNSQNSNDDGSTPDAAYVNKLSKAISSANASLKALMINREFSYRIHEATHRLIVDVKNSETGEVIKEIPSEDDLDMIAKMQELAGIIIDERR